MYARTCAHGQQSGAHLCTSTRTHLHTHLRAHMRARTHGEQLGDDFVHVSVLAHLQLAVCVRARVGVCMPAAGHAQWPMWAESSGRCGPSRVADVGSVEWPMWAQSSGRGGCVRAEQMKWLDMT